MESREVTGTQKDSMGRVVRIGGAWGSRPISGVAIDIMHSQYRYFVRTESGEVDLCLVQGEDSHYVRAVSDLERRDLLENLRDL